MICHYTFSPHYGHRIVVLKGSVKIGVHCNTNEHNRKSGDDFKILRIILDYLEIKVSTYTGFRNWLRSEVLEGKMNF